MDDKQLDRIEKKLESIDEKLSIHLERIAILEEKQSTDRGAIALIMSGIMSAAGWLLYKFLQ